MLLFTVAQYLQSGLGRSPVQSGLTLVPWVAAALTGRMTGAVPARHAPDISGVSATLMSIGGSVGVAAIGSLYLALTRTGTPEAHGAATAGHAFAVTTAALAGVAVLAALAAQRATWTATAPATQAQAPSEARVEVTALMTGRVARESHPGVRLSPGALRCGAARRCPGR